MEGEKLERTAKAVDTVDTVDNGKPKKAVKSGDTKTTVPCVVPLIVESVTTKPSKIAPR